MQGKSWQFIVKWVLRALAILFTGASIIVLILLFQEVSDLASLNNVLVGMAAAVGSLLSSFLFKERKSDRPTITRADYLSRLERRCNVPYVSLKTEGTQHIDSKFEAYDEWLGRNPEVVVEVESIDSIEQALNRYKGQKFVLIGEPGAGKTTMLRYVALRLIADYRAVKGDGKISPMPLWVNLGDSGNPSDASELIRYAWQETERIEGDPDLDLRDGLVWLLLDGLNEMPDELTGPGTIENRAKSLRSFLDDYDGPAIITCRVADYDDRLDLGLPVVRILRLSDEEIEDFAGQLDTQQDEFLDALAEKPERQALAANPYALTMLIDIFRDPKYALPDNREGLYNAYVQMRYDRYPKDAQGRARIKGKLKRLKKGWSKLAYQMLLDARGTRVDARWARRIAGKHRLRAGINLCLISPDEPDKGLVSFYHDSLHEHFALSWVNLRKGNIRQRVRLIERLGRSGEVALPVVPDLTELFIEEANQEDVMVYNTTRHATFEILDIKVNVAIEPAQRFCRLSYLETALKIVALTSNFTPGFLPYLPPDHISNLNRRFKDRSKGLDQQRIFISVAYALHLDPNRAFEQTLEHALSLIHSFNRDLSYTRDLPLSKYILGLASQRERALANVLEGLPHTPDYIVTLERVCSLASTYDLVLEFVYNRDFAREYALVPIIQPNDSDGVLSGLQMESFVIENIPQLRQDIHKELRALAAELAGRSAGDGG